MTQVGEGVALGNISEEEIPYHFSGIQICYPNGKPYTEFVPLFATLNGSKNPNPVNLEGFSFLSHLEPGSSVSFEIGQDPGDELTKTRQSIKDSLDEIIVLELHEQKIMDDIFDDEQWWMQGTIMLGAFMSGVGDGAIGLVEFTGDVAETGAKALWLNIQSQGNMLEAGWEKYVEGDKKGYFDSLDEKNSKDFADAFGITPEQLKKNMLLAYEMMAFIAEDSEVQKLLADFSVEYVKAQSKVEMVNVAGSAAFDIILGAVLALTTGGAGNVAQISAKLRHVTQLKGLAMKFQKLLKLQKQKKTHIPEVKGNLDEVVKHNVELPKALKLDTNKVKDETLKKKKEEKKESNEADNKEQQQDNSQAKTNSDETGKNDGDQVCSADSKTCQGGEPISLVTGEEILPLTDFTLDGPLSQPWERRYKSSNLQNIGLGYGWTHPFAESLNTAKNGAINYRNSEARNISLPLPMMKGDTTTNRAEQLQLTRLDSNSYSLRSLGASVEKIFSQNQTNGAFVLTQIRDSFGNHFSLSYANVANGIERLVHITASTGSQWKLHYNKQAQLSHVDWQTAAGHQQTLVQYQYDNQLDLTAATDAKGNREQYRYKNHLITQRTLKSGYSYHFLWDGDTNKARCVRNWGDHINGQPTYEYHFNWDKANNRVAITDTRRGTETYQFNDRGLPVYHQDQEGGVTRYSYDERGNLVSETNPMQAALRYVYDYSNDQLRTFIDSSGAQHQLERDSLGNITASIDPLGNRWQRSYNELGQLSQQSNPLGESHHYQYNELGLVSRITDPLEQSWHYIWDNQGQLIAMRDPNGLNTRYRYNAANQIDTITYPDDSTTHYRYDANVQCTAIKGPDGEVQQFAYSPLGLLTHQGDSSGKTTQYQYNGLSQVVKRIDPLGQTLDYHYDGERNLIGLTNEKGKDYHLRYDLNERLIEEVGFDGRLQKYHYNAAGHLTASDDISENGKSLLGRLHYQRDTAGRLIKQYAAAPQAANEQTASKILLNSFDYD
uniref:DUF6531 domain-containing protein n=1 Tax=Psychromonas sp. Urea-02u-13 TaxID=2058326 RepID=UPI000CAC2C69